jgi:hypothetical protein
VSPGQAQHPDHQQEPTKEEQQPAQHFAHDNSLISGIDEVAAL